MKQALLEEINIDSIDEISFKHKKEIHTLFQSVVHDALLNLPNLYTTLWVRDNQHQKYIKIKVIEVRKMNSQSDRILSVRHNYGLITIHPEGKSLWKTKEH